MYAVSHFLVASAVTPSITDSVQYQRILGVHKKCMHAMKNSVAVNTTL